MAIAYVGERAAGSTAAGSGTTQAITLASGFSAGDTAVLAFAARDTSTAGCSVADSRGNTWTIDKGPLNQSNNFVMIASTRQDVGVLQAGDTVTNTFGTAPGDARLWIVQEISGLVTASYVDQTGNDQSASSSSGTSGSVTTTQADELLVVAWCQDNSAGNAVPTRDGTFSDWTTPYQDASGGTHKGMCSQYRIVNATGTYSASISWASARSWQGMIVSYKAAAVSAQSLPADLGNRVRRNSLLCRCSGIFVPRLWLPAPGELIPAI